MRRSRALIRPLAGCLNRMAALTSISLGCNVMHSDAWTFRELFRSVYLPCLANLELTAFTFNPHDMTRLLITHAATLKGCSFVAMLLEHYEPETAYRSLFQNMHDRLGLESLFFEGFKNDSTIDCPLIDRTRMSDQPNEEGYIVVNVDDYIELPGR